MKKESIFLALNEINLDIFRVISMRYKEAHLDVTPVQSRIIMFVYDEAKEMCQKDIEGLVPCNKSTLSAVLNTMEKNGLITRLGDIDDSRKKIIHLTEKSLSIVTQLKRDHAYITSKISDGVSENELKILSSIIDKMKHNLERM